MNTGNEDQEEKAYSPPKGTKIPDIPVATGVVIESDSNFSMLQNRLSMDDIFVATNDDFTIYKNETGNEWICKIGEGTELVVLAKKDKATNVRLDRVSGCPQQYIQGWIKNEELLPPEIDEESENLIVSRKSTYAFPAITEKTLLWGPLDADASICELIVDQQIIIEKKLGLFLTQVTLEKENCKNDYVGSATIRNIDLLPGSASWLEKVESVAKVVTTDLPLYEQAKERDRIKDDPTVDIDPICSISGGVSLIVDLARKRVQIPNSAACPEDLKIGWFVSEVAIFNE